jgi:hypothetical protein
MSELAPTLTELRLNAARASIGVTSGSKTVRFSKNPIQRASAPIHGEIHARYCHLGIQITGYSSLRKVSTIGRNAVTAIGTSLE